MSRLLARITPTDPTIASAVTSSLFAQGPTQPAQIPTFYNSLLGGAGANEAATYALQAQQDYYQAFTSGGMATGGVVTGGIPGRDSVPKLLMPGERVLTVAQNKDYERGMQGGGPGPVTINITVNGHVDDPEEMARILAPKLRDELRRIEPRYSRAGNKTQV